MEMPYRSGCDLHVHSGTANGKYVWCAVVVWWTVCYMLSYAQRNRSVIIVRNDGIKKTKWEKSTESDVVCWCGLHLHNSYSECNRSVRVWKRGKRKRLWQFKSREVKKNFWRIIQTHTHTHSYRHFQFKFHMHARCAYIHLPVHTRLVHPLFLDFDLSFACEKTFVYICVCMTMFWNEK